MLILHDTLHSNSLVLLLPRLTDSPFDLNERALHAGTVKRHNVCKRHVAIGTGFKQTERTIFSPRYFNGIQINCNLH